MPNEEFATRDPTLPMFEQMTADAAQAATDAGYTHLIETKWDTREPGVDVVDVTFFLWAYGDAQLPVPVWPASTHELAKSYGGRTFLAWKAADE